MQSLILIICLIVLFVTPIIAITADKEYIRKHYVWFWTITFGLMAAAALGILFLTSANQ